MFISEEDFKQMKKMLNKFQKGNYSVEDLELLKSYTLFTYEAVKNELWDIENEC